MAGVEKLGSEAGRWTYATSAAGRSGKPAPAPPPEADPAAAQAAVARQRSVVVNDMLRVLDVNVRFRVEEDYGLVRIEVVDGNTGEIIRTVPPEYFLRATATLPRAIGTKGLILDEDV